MVIILSKLFEIIFGKTNFDKHLKFNMFGVSVCIILVKLSVVFLPFLFGKLLDSLNKLNSASSFFIPIAFVLFYGAVQLSSKFFLSAQEIFFSKFVERITRNISVFVMNHIHTLSHSFYTQNKPGMLAQTIRLGIRASNAILSSFIFNFIPMFIEFLFILSIFFYSFNFIITFFLFASIVIYFALSYFLTRLRLNTIRNLNLTEAEAHGFFSDTLTNFETIKLFINKSKITEEYNNKLKGQEKLTTRATLHLCLLKMVQDFVLSIIFILFLITTIFEFKLGQISLGQLVMVVHYLIQLLLPVENLVIEQDLVRKSVVDLEGLFKILDTTPEIRDEQNAKSLSITAGEIRFNNVSFGYDGGKKKFNNLSFEIPGKTTVAFVGISGAGKTTVIRLLLHLYNIQSGSILIDNQDIKKVKQASIRDQIGIVPQDIILFNDTIEFNINCFHSNNNNLEIKKAAKISQIHDEIERMPKKYQTLVGERGLLLSTGEKQRIALARAIIRYPKILVFDEATSSLDLQTEREIQKGLHVMKNKCTIILIAHRLSTVVNADQIFVFDKGSIVEKGTHHTLMQNNGVYKKLWDSSLID